MSNLARQLQREEVQHQQQEKRRTTVIKKSKVTKGEKFFYILFVAMVVLFSVKIIGSQAAIYKVNKQIQIIQSDITDQQRVTEDLQAQVDELSEYGRLLDAAKKQGLTMNENNVKVVQNNK
ncbi:cell division protein FtsL [Caldibacillus lycopersici]|uniref:Cell division protein FtsL n=1 Tax=Perspicuibacillus lycopersici TaxID=1325689 RepID=A0AAE3LPC5_9BACI|nr:cell division protein FtsL [Perspicuibacillus lycopersici]MCU9612204.1 cell division protein FtsL [Perspicuibacillus lycopersici]